MVFVWHVAAYAAPGAVQIDSVAERDVETVINGKKELRRMPVTKAVPGDEIIYTSRFKNPGNKPAGNIVITNPVPNDTAYKSGSAIGGNTDIAFSIDGGKQFAAADQLSVKTQEGKTRPALPTDYTHIRWIYKGELGAGKSGEVSFRALVK